MIDDATYFSDLSGIPKEVVLAWIEEAKSKVYSNPLAIPYEGSSRMLQTGQVEMIATYETATDGLNEAWAILQLPAYERIRQAIATRDPLTIADAIEKSNWSDTHYGAHPSDFASGRISERFK